MLFMASNQFGDIMSLMTRFWECGVNRHGGTRAYCVHGAFFLSTNKLCRSIRAATISVTEGLGFIF